jgi:hypothetical protein
MMKSAHMGAIFRVQTAIRSLRMEKRGSNSLAEIQLAALDEV